MIAVSTTVTDKDKAAWDALMKGMKLKEAYVTVGVHESAGEYTGVKDPPSVAEVAMWNEFGTSRTPERSYLRSTVDENVGRIQDLTAKGYDTVLESFRTGNPRESFMKLLKTIGFQVKVLVQNKIKSSVPPALAKGTIEDKERRGSLHPTSTLRDTDLLLRSITDQEVIK